MTWAVKQELPAMQKIVLLMMANRSSPETGACFPSVKTLAKECGMSIRAATNQITLLKAAGLIEVENQFRKDGGQTSNSYILKFEKEIKFRDLPNEEEVLKDESPISVPVAQDAEPSAPEIEPSAPNAYKTEIINKNNKQQKAVNNAGACVADFVPPLAQDVFNYWAAMCLMLSMDEAEAFVDYYTATGWKLGNTQIVDWYSKARTWAKNNQKFELRDMAKKTTRSNATTNATSERKKATYVPPRNSSMDTGAAIDSFVVNTNKTLLGG
jgi:hypothetical protein